MKKLLVLALVAILCLSGVAHADVNGGDTLNIALASTPETIDPTLNTTVDSACYAVHQFEPLMRYKWDGKGVEYGMAGSYDVSDDGLVWTFYLRDSLWSDGEPVKAQDFDYAFRRLVNPDVAAPYGYDMGSFIKNGGKIVLGEDGLTVDDLGVKVIDDKTLEVTLEAPCPFFLEIMAFPVFSPIRQDIIEKYGADNWIKSGESYVTNGPFMMESFSLDEAMISIKNPGYWDVDNLKPAKINWLFLSDDKAELAALRAGEADYIDGFPQEEMKSLKAEGLYGRIEQLGTYYISYNINKEPLNNPLVRKALTLAIDTDFIANVLREGTVSPAEAFVGNGFRTSGASKDFRDGYPSYVSPSDYETNKLLAQEALAEAGYPGGEGIPKIEYLLNDNTGHIMIAEAIQAMWKEVLGISIEIRVADWSVVTVDRRAGNFQIARQGWIGDYNDPATMLTLLLSSSGNNDGKYNSPKFDELIAASMAETDPEARNLLLHQAEDVMLGEDWAIAPIYYYTNQYGVRPDLKGWGIMPLGYKLFHGAYIE